MIRGHIYREDETILPKHVARRNMRQNFHNNRSE